MTGEWRAPGEEPVTAAAEDKGFWDADPGLRAVRDWARARRAGPYSLLGEVLQQVAARIPPQVVLPPLGVAEAGKTQGAASLNQLLASVGRSGLSKGLGHQLADEIIQWPDGIRAPVYAPLGSGEGIAATYVTCQKDEEKNYVMVRLASSAVFVATEIDKLAALLGRKNATLGGVLRSAWSGEPLGETNAAEANRRFVSRHSYRASVVVHVQPGRAGALLNADEAAAGTPQRVLWLPAADPDAPDMAPAPPALLRWVAPGDVVAAVADLGPNGLDRLGELPLVVLPVCAKARTVIEGAAVSRLRLHADALDGHALLVREKLAAILAVFLGRFGVADEDWDLAGHLMTVSDQTRRAVAEELRRAVEVENEARGKAEARRAQIVSVTTEKAILSSAKNRVLAVLRRADKGEWVATAALRGQLSTAQRDCFPLAIEQLIADELISEQGTTAGHGAIGVEYAIRND